MAPKDVPPYAILSHTWGDDEVVFTDLVKSPPEWQSKVGFAKIEFCAKQARKDGLQYFWVDTCCINKSDSQELQTAINSMFRWYHDAKQCYVYFSDVSGNSPTYAALKQSRWFTRGWTLQELIAPSAIGFYSKQGDLIGTKQLLESTIRDITGIPAAALRGAPLSDFPVLEREAWIRGRQTKYEEDLAYSLFGIFNVHMPLIYGEGLEKARNRLREEIRKAIKGTHTQDFSVPFSLSEAPNIDYFVARKAELSQMRRHLCSDGSRRVVVLHGLGGIGKTQLAVAYMKQRRDEYSAIFWFNIRSKASIQQSFIEAARQILRHHPTASYLDKVDLQGNQEAVVEAVKAWLSLPSNMRWLAIYDNYDNPNLPDQENIQAIDIQAYLPSSYQGSIIVTTRLSQVDVGLQIPVKTLEAIQDGMKILSSTSGRDILCNDADAKKLAEKLDGLPLALAMAGTYLKRVPTASYADYLRLYDTFWERLHTEMQSLGSYKDRTLCSTWKISYDQVQDQNPLAAQLLQWWAFFDHHDIWFELFQSARQDNPAWTHDLADELNFNNAMATLQDYGFVELNSFSDDVIESKGYNIHSCLHSWTIHILNAESDDVLRKAALQCVASRVPATSEAKFWLLQRRLLPHAIACSATVKDDDDHPNWVFSNLGILYTDQGILDEAEVMYLRALNGYENALGPDDKSTLDTIHYLGVIYGSQERFKEAEAMFLRALAGYETLCGPYDVSTLDMIGNFGLLYKDQGRFKEAESLYLHALSRYEKTYGPNHTSTLYILNNLGILYIEQDRLSEAEVMLLHALGGFEKTLEPDHPTTLDIVNNLGALYANQKRLNEAEVLFLRALEGKTKAWKPNHTSIFETVNNLGRLYTDQDRLEEAEPMLLHALKGKENAFGPDHTSTLNTVDGLGLLYKSQGRLDEAEAMHLRALAGKEKTLGPDHTSTLYTVDNLGSLYKRQGRLDEAEAMDLRVRVAEEKELKSDYTSILDTGS